MYGLKHHVAGEKGHPGNPESANLVRYTGRMLLALAAFAGCVGFGGWSPHGSAFFDTLAVLLLIGGAAVLFYESQLQDRISHWGR